MRDLADQFSSVERLCLDADAPALLAERLLSRLVPGRRVVVGIAGIPGSGKSTLARQVVDALNQRSSSGSAVLVPMDGFHFTNRRLDELGLRDRKGSPPTFDAAGYVELLSRARDERVSTFFPIYDRALHEPVLREAPEQRIGVGHRFIVTEGNYLLLDQPPWNVLAGVLDECWFVHVPIELAEQWILARHVRGGRTPADARAHYLRNDLPNSQLIQSHSRPPDLWLMQVERRDDR